MASPSGVRRLAREIPRSDRQQNQGTSQTEGTMVTRRLTRQESQQRTRERLLAAGADEFARQGFAATSIEQIVERAGYTRGAFYSNFANLEELLLAIMDTRLAEARAGLSETFAGPGDLDALLSELQGRNDARPTHRRAGAFLLTIEFWLYSMRHRRVRRRLAQHYSEVRSTYAEVITKVCTAAAVEPPASVDDLAAALLALDTGLLLQRMVDETVLPDDRYRALMAGLGRWVLFGGSEVGEHSPGGG
jgi:AcrR family transcriptional regulator